MAEESLDRIREWEERTGGFVSITSRGNGGGSSSGSGVPF